MTVNRYTEAEHACNLSYALRSVLMQLHSSHPLGDGFTGTVRRGTYEMALRALKEYAQDVHYPDTFLNIRSSGRNHEDSGHCPKAHLE